MRNKRAKILRKIFTNRSIYRVAKKKLRNVDICTLLRQNEEALHEMVSNDM